jgi:shikimate kinase
MKKVVLIGYMGSGKSIIAKKLSDKIGLACFELDDLIEEKSKMTIEKIFTSRGELYFRKLEHQFFLELLSDENSSIISTGGGTPCYFNNDELMKTENVVSFYLKASVATLYNRLVKEKVRRPLIAHLDNNEIQEFIAKHLFERSYYYNQAQYKISVDEKTIEEIVEEIFVLLA